MTTVPPSWFSPANGDVEHAVEPFDDRRRCCRREPGRTAGSRGVEDGAGADHVRAAEEHDRVAVAVGRRDVNSCTASPFENSDHSPAKYVSVGHDADGTFAAVIALSTLTWAMIDARASIAARIDRVDDAHIAAGLRKAAAPPACWSPPLVSTM